MRKVADEERVRNGAVAHGIAVDVDEVRDLREREERDAERKDDCLEPHVGAKQRVQARDEKARILEIAEHGEVDGDRPREEAECLPAQLPPRRAIASPAKKLNAIDASSNGTWRQLHQP
jgi:hypothetical protein